MLSSEATNVVVAAVVAASAGFGDMASDWCPKDQYLNPELKLRRAADRSQE